MPSRFRIRNKCCSFAKSFIRSVRVPSSVIIQFSTLANFTYCPKEIDMFSPAVVAETPPASDNSADTSATDNPSSSDTAIERVPATHADSDNLAAEAEFPLASNSSTASDTFLVLVPVACADSAGANAADRSTISDSGNEHVTVTHADSEDPDTEADTPPASNKSIVTDAAGNSAASGSVIELVPFTHADSEDPTAKQPPVDDAAAISLPPRPSIGRSIPEDMVDWTTRAISIIERVTDIIASIKAPEIPGYASQSSKLARLVDRIKAATSKLAENATKHSANSTSYSVEHSMECTKLVINTCGSVCVTMEVASCYGVASSSDVGRHAWNAAITAVDLADASMAALRVAATNNEMDHAVCLSQIAKEVAAVADLLAEVAKQAGITAS